jgi:phosphopantothenoylcysteine decarboxylase/phosphopantothenate--cysteine ligase
VDSRTAGQTIVGFAAETGDETAAVIEYGRKKLAAKGCDLLVVNDVSGGAVFERADNQVIILDRSGGQQSLPREDKSLVADHVWDAVMAFRSSAS